MKIYANIWNDTLNNVFQTNEVVIKFNLSEEEMEIQGYSTIHIRENLHTPISMEKVSFM